MGDKRLRGRIKKVWVLSRVGRERSVLDHLGLLAVLGHSPSLISRLMKRYEVHSLLRVRETSPDTLMGICNWGVKKRKAITDQLGCSQCVWNSHSHSALASNFSLWP